MAYEKMPCLYETVQDLTDRLHGTICRYKGKAVFVSVQSKDLICLINPVKTGDVLFKIKPNDPDFDISSAEVGYMNFEPNPEHMRYQRKEDFPSGVVWIDRMPQRKYRQGLYPECLDVSTIKGNHVSGHYPGMVVCSQGLVDMVEGSYPPFRTGLAVIRNPKFSLSSIALSKDVALESTESGMVLVYIRCTNIGWIEPGESLVQIKRNAREGWLIQQMLSSVNIPVGGPLG